MADDGPWNDYVNKTPPGHDEEGPWSQFKADPKKELPTSPLKSAAYGAAQGATFGFADEGIAGAKALLSKLTNPQSSFGDTYDKEVADQRNAIAKAKNDNPMTYTGGNLAGNVATSFIPGIGIAKGAGLASTLGKAGLQGALIGAGESDKSITNPEALGEDVAKGAAYGAGTQAAFGGLAGILGKFAPSNLNNFAEQRAVKAALGPNTAALRQAAGITTKGGNTQAVEQKISNMGRDLLDEGVISPLSKTQDIGPKLKEAAQKYGSQIGEVGKQVDQAVPNAIDTKNIAQQIADYAQTIPPTLNGKKIQDRLMAEAANFEEMPGMGFGAAQDFKNQFKYKPTDQDALISNQDVSNKIRQIIGQNMEDAAGKVQKSGSDSAKDLLAQYQNAKAKYGTFKPASDAAGNEATKELARRFVSPSDYAMGIGGLGTAVATGSPHVAVAGLAAAAANKFARERGSSTAASIADSLAKTLDASPEFAKEFGNVLTSAMQRGPAALTATHAILMKNPSYRQQFQGQSPNGANEGATQ